jgi:hypothetical protein
VEDGYHSGGTVVPTPDVAWTKAEADARFAPISHTHAAADIASGTLALARLPREDTV